MAKIPTFDYFTRSGATHCNIVREVQRPGSTRL